MSIGNWFKRFFSSAKPGDETSLDEVRIDAGGGTTGLGGEYAGAQTEELVEGELSEFEEPSE